ncbi:trehalose synthase [Saccharothrix sp. NRRL B-16348]|uniref:alpha-amylase family protein n=1 Tax=Saccharothrix sp. NRRL B-16348 TaxID=1415542 RepID=UPI0006AE6193|nr:alpha-amylase family protein [Saccharothrix sp. NRRL B-16348]KOX24003.1 trehalose synthase [Saccharothrix sp. NRRL B-16348]
MVERWYRNGIIYSADVSTFQDSDGDGVGDLPGLASRLNYLSRLGVDTVWLNPLHPSPRRDGGYDVVDHYGVDPRFGTLGDFADLLHQADERGIRIMIDLVLNHTSDRHPWFRSACADRDSPYRDWYVWSDAEPADRWDGAVFPGSEDATWTYQEEAGRWYRHRFYSWEPDLNTDHPAVRDEFCKIMGFWLRLGVAGFRVDATPFVIESRSAPPEPDYELLGGMHRVVSWRSRDAVLLAEANVETERLLDYFGDADGEASRMMMLFAFRLNQAMMLALARHDATPIRDVLATLPSLPKEGQWATFLRNHDEVDLSALTPEEREDVFREFGPEPDMRVYERGIRRRMASMLCGDRRRIELAYSLLLSMPGTPVIRYGDEIGMGEDLALPERDSVRTPMQWTDTRNAGFSTAPPERLIAPVIADGPYRHQLVNVLDQRRDPDSLLTWFERILHTRRECEEIGVGDHEVVDVGERDVLAHIARGEHGVVLFVHNFGERDLRLQVPPLPGEAHRPLSVAADGEYPEDIDLLSLEVRGRGYRWLRLNHTPWD